MDNSDVADKDVEKAYLIKPLWHFLFFAIGLVCLLVIGLAVRVLTGLSAAEDRVFAVEALLSGLLAEFIILKWFRKKLYLFPKLNLRFYYFWILLSLYVFIFQPFE